MPGPEWIWVLVVIVLMVAVFLAIVAGVVSLVRFLRRR
jgi:uncharacterized membrane protein YgaE (UPF0421/DUF939 family)